MAISEVFSALHSFTAFIFYSFILFQSTSGTRAYWVDIIKWLWINVLQLFGNYFYGLNTNFYVAKSNFLLKSGEKFPLVIIYCCKLWLHLEVIKHFIFIIVFYTILLNVFYRILTPSVKIIIVWHHEAWPLLVKNSDSLI